MGFIIYIIIYYIQFSETSEPNRDRCQSEIRPGLHSTEERGRGRHRYYRHSQVRDVESRRENLPRPTQRKRHLRAGSDPTRSRCQLYCGNISANHT